MADIDITQPEADGLIAMEKKRVDNKEWLFSPPGETIAIPLVSVNKREHFMLDVSRARKHHGSAQHSERTFLMTIAQEIDKLLNDYRAWLKDKTTLREVNGSWVEITTPYLDRRSDALQIYARQENGGYILTDDCYTIHDLESSGCSINTDKRQDLLKMTLNGFGVKLNNEALEVHATPENFPLRKHNLIQAMLAVNDLFYLAKPIVESLFYEDVIAWLEASDIRYSLK